MATLAPPPPPSDTRNTMFGSSSTSQSSDTSSDSRSAGSSPNSSGTSPLVSFDHPLDPSDPLRFLADPLAVDTHSSSGVDSSTEDSLCSPTPPSLHDSPAGDWSTTSAPGKDSADVLWPQSDFSSFSLDNFNPLAGMEFQLGLDSMLFSGDSLFMDSSASGTQNGMPTDISYTCNFGNDDVQNSHIQPANVDDKRPSISSSSPSHQLVSANNHSQVVPGPSPSILQDIGSAPQSCQSQVPNDQLMDELAARARQIVGLTMALPVNGNPTTQPSVQFNSQQELVAGVPAVSHIPAPSAQAPSVPPVPSSESSTPSPTSTPAPTSTRTKTSHTTIERRYRTNLNARIQSLRAAVPALRVLEVKAGNRVGNLPLKAGTRRVGIDPGAEAGQEDVIDERGYIDGVKVARKGSKANVLGKAVEYIRVLKRREMRLKREKDGLKALVRSLVGGPELVQQWETMWTERFGGPEKDQVDGEDAEVDDENDDGDDDDDAIDKEERDEELLGNKRKRAKVDTTSTTRGKGKKTSAEAGAVEHSQQTQPIPVMPSQSYPNQLGMSVPIPAQPEKRKRGRPRKVPLPPATASNVIGQSPFTMPSTARTIQQQPVPEAPMSLGMRMDVEFQQSTSQSDLQSPQVQVQTQPQPGQYLLAAFAFFSFFNSPIPYRAPSFGSRSGYAHEYSGSVLGERHPDTATMDLRSMPSRAFTFSWHDVVQIVHLAVSVLLFFSMVLPWVPRLAKFIPRPLRGIMGAGFTADPTKYPNNASEDRYNSEEEKADAEARAALLSALGKGHTLTPAVEARVLRDALGLGTGAVGFFLSLTRQMSAPSKSRSCYGLERRMLEQKAFLRFAELIALDAHASMMTRIQTYIYAFRFFSIFSASVKDISTLALVIRPVWHAKSAALWALALSRAQGKDSSSPHVCKAYELHVLEKMTIDEAAVKVAEIDQGEVTTNAVSVHPNTGSTDQGGMFHEPTSPLAVLARHAIRNAVRTHAENVFLRTVAPDEADYDCGNDNGEIGTEFTDSEIRHLVDAGRSLDTRTVSLVDKFERVCNPTSARFTSTALLDSEVFELKTVEATNDLEDKELHDLLRAIVLYRRIFPSTLLRDTECKGPANGASAGISVSLTPMLSPPPSPSRRDGALHLALRRCLDSAAFDRGDALEDARDRVVDLLTSESSSWQRQPQY
ncbi:uncharacterized protein FOMMEDRAFT_145060 [Fomitiporia mediterranea MF3/22]|uniref:uncharacterized protein n=1 Tax=Fomitiporia mediterranea (strain MF3/22) TaxID=694068 RepID=UPI0004409567|nr:uncharacterized protein FOMMEDRAFT_145060 [Fomitiporia mediterranea MF3/22]EJD05561.1 hypothetical protein FOMMEDRAFT_145060 [Fomitiporia mediterranea MF3/22]